MNFFSLILVFLLSLLLIIFIASFFVFKNKYAVFSSLFLIGFLSFLIGLLGTLIGMMGAFDAIQATGDISPSLFWGGLSVALETTFYGFYIFIISIICLLIKSVFLLFK